MHKVLVLTRNQRPYLEKLQAMNLPGLEVFAPETEEEVVALLDKVDIVLGNPPIVHSLINDVTQLKWYQSTFAGVDAMTAPGLRRDYLLTNVKETYGVIMGEYVMAYILAFEKELFENRAYQLAKQWQQRPFVSIAGKTLLILGTGSIGKEIARLGQAFALKTVGYKRSPGEVEYFDATVTREGLEAALAQADYVVNVLPNTPETTDLIAAPTLAHMKAEAIFINVGRGNAVNEEDLLAAVQQGRLAKAVLDVFKTEPLPEDSGLWDEENVHVTPHISGYTVSERIFEIFEENYCRFVAGEELIYQVDLERGY